MRRLGCGGCLLVAFGVFVVCMATIYVVMMHTSLPLKLIAYGISQDDAIEIKGVTGSISSGFQVESIRYDDGKLPPSEIDDLRLRYHGMSGWGGQGGFIVDEAHVGKATLHVKMPKATTAEAEIEVKDKTDDAQPADQVHHETRQFQATTETFRVDKISLNNLVIKDTESDFELSIPKIDWTGLKIENGKLDVGTLTVVSDRLDVQTLPGVPEEIDGKRIEFNRRLVGLIKAKLHPALRQEIDVECDLLVDNPEKPIVRLRAARGKLDAFLNADRSGYVRCDDFDVSSYLDAAPQDLPKSIWLDAKFSHDPTKGEYLVDVQHGSFNLGETHFTLERPQQIKYQPKGREPIVVRATCRQGATIFTYELTLSKRRQVQQRLFATPELSPLETLAHVLLGKSTDELSADELEQLESKLPIYFPNQLAERPEVEDGKNRGDAEKSAEESQPQIDADERR